MKQHRTRNARDTAKVTQFPLKTHLDRSPNTTTHYFASLQNMLYQSTQTIGFMALLLIPVIYISTQRHEFYSLQNDFSTMHSNVPFLAPKHANTLTSNEQYMIRAITPLNVRMRRGVKSEGRGIESAQSIPSFSRSAPYTSTNINRDCGRTGDSRCRGATHATSHREHQQPGATVQTQNRQLATN